MIAAVCYIDTRSTAVYGTSSSRPVRNRPLYIHAAPFIISSIWYETGNPGRYND
jgi:hypothetical protein